MWGNFYTGFKSPCITGKYELTDKQTPQREINKWGCKQAQVTQARRGSWETRSSLFLGYDTEGGDKTLRFTWSLKQVGGWEGIIFHYIDQTQVHTGSSWKVSLCVGVGLTSSRAVDETFHVQWCQEAASTVSQSESALSSRHRGAKSRDRGAFRNSAKQPKHESLTLTDQCISVAKNS